MAVKGLTVRSRGPYEDGISFGAVGPYERLDGTVHFAVAPELAANAAITDLDRAARSDDGRVHFSADFCLLQPVELRRGNRRLLFHVANRGRLGTVPFNNAAAPPSLVERIDPGDGFLMRHGWTVLWVGWQWDVIARPGLVGLAAPLAVTTAGQPIESRIVLQFQPNEVHHHQLLAHWPLHPVPGNPDFAHHPYPAADCDEPDAVLTVREHLDGPRRVIPRQEWRFARADGDTPVTDENYVWLGSGFQPGLLYELVYRTRHSPVVGAGLLAVRDSVSFFRRADLASGNPCAGRIDYSFGFGVSQCGRFLRDYLYHGMNVDEHGQRVFDGLIPHVAGARRGEFNFRGAQPSAQHVRNLAHQMPFTDDDQTDPLTGRTAGLLTRQRALGGLPKIITTNTSSEYWRIDGSLIHTDLAGTKDIEPPAEVRIYLFAGTQHGPGILPLNRATPAGAMTANFHNIVNYTPLLRAALVNLERWVTVNQPPPPSQFPRLADGTAVPRERVLGALAGYPGDRPDPALLPTVRRVVSGPGALTASDPLPLPVGEPYPSFVAAIDADGNEMAGLRLPDLTVPLATHTGWNPRHASIGGAGQLVDMLGSSIPLAPTAAARSAVGDPRLSIAERYLSREDYLARVRAAAEALVAERYLLAEDVDLVVMTADERWQALAQS